MDNSQLTDSNPVAWLAIYHGEVCDEAIGITRSVVEAQADRFGWELALTEIIPLYRHPQSAVDCCQQMHDAEIQELRKAVIPVGWQLVPIEPTEGMIVDGFESEPDEDFSDPKEWAEYEAMSGCQQAAHRAKLCWASMLSASPTAPDLESI